MSARAKDLADEAKLYRESGHCTQARRLVTVAKTHYPAEECLKTEEKKLLAAANPSFPRCRGALSTLVDRLGLPLFFMLMAYVAWLLGPILLIPAGQ